jgi:hypothetical protein
MECNIHNRQAHAAQAVTGAAVLIAATAPAVTGLVDGMELDVWELGLITERHARELRSLRMRVQELVLK